MIQIRQSKRPATVIRLNFLLAHGDGLLMPQDWNYGRTPGLCKQLVPCTRLEGFERFYEKVIKVKADVAAFSYLFLPSRILEGWRAVKGGADRQRSC